MTDLQFSDIKHIIWDWNGTLLDDLDLCISIINPMLEKRGLKTISREQYLDKFDFPVRDYYLKIGFNLELEPFESISTEFITAYESGRPDCQLMDSARETLDFLHNTGHTQSILSASKKSYLTLAVLDHGINHYFNAIMGLDNHHAAGKISLARSYINKIDLAPAEILLIGDTIHDAEIANEIRVNYILIPNGHQNRKRLTETGGILVNSLKDLVDSFRGEADLMNPKSRIEYIDNLRIFLTASVIINHILITYGGPGGWYYREYEYSQLDIPTSIILVLFTAFHQAYIMGFFFFISGYFSSKSLSVKKTSRFLVQRFIRLGIPILLFVYLVSPLLRVIFKRVIFDQAFNFSSFSAVYQQLEFGYELGPMWFALLLLILSILFLPLLLNSRFSIKLQGNPTPLKILVYALLTGILTFLVRLAFPVGFVFQPLNLQIPQVVQYVFSFLMGIMAYHGGWFDEIGQLFSRSWLYLILGLILSMPVVFIFSGGLEGDVTPALGGLHWQSFAYSLWEQLFCISMIVTGFYYFKKFANSSNSFSRELASSTYAAYLIHPLVLVTYTILTRNFSVHPLFKISFTILPAIILSFLAAS